MRRARSTGRPGRPGCRAAALSRPPIAQRRSPVPVMLDELICELADVKRASANANVGFCKLKLKLKLKRFGGSICFARRSTRFTNGTWTRCSAMICLRSLGVGWKPVWRASPFAFNGFLKPNVRLFSEPLWFAAGELVLPSRFTRTIDAHTLAAHETASERFTPTVAGWTTRIN